MPCLSPRSSHLLFLGFRSRPSPRLSRILLAFLFLALTVNLPAQTLSILHTFTGGSGGAGGSGSLIQASDGNFYGVGFAGAHGSGTIYRITPSGEFTTLYTFTGGDDGADSNANLVQGSDGNFYGTTANGGAHAYGTIFKLTPSGAFTLLHAFALADGTSPIIPLVQGSDGNFYGMTGYGGSGGHGTIFKITPAGVFTLLHSFTGTSTDGGTPYDGLVQGTDGNFYGTTQHGGTNSNGTVFKISSSGAFTLLHAFDGTDGANPDQTLLENSDGNFYVLSGPLGQIATLLYTMTPSGDLTQVFEFTNNPNDGVPNALFLASDGISLYSSTESGGPMNLGSLFALYPSADYEFAQLSSFSNAVGAGYHPLAGLVQGSDGNFYGDTFTGGPNNSGTIYKLVPASPLPAPVQVTLSQSAVEPGTPVTVSFSVSNAFSLTMQQCYAFQTVNNTTTTALGILAGTYSSSTKLFTGSTTVTPSTIGVYTYALTCGGIESNSATLFVGNATSTVLAATPDPVVIGQQVTLQATVTGSGAVPTGKVTFSVDGVTLGTATLNGSGVASITASSKGIAPGKYPLIAAYSGNSSYKSSTSAALPVTIAAYPTTTSLTASPNPVTPPASVTLTATVARAPGGAIGTPTGTVTFTAYSGLTEITLGTVKLNSSGVATFTASTQGIGSGFYSIFADYNGDSTDDISASPQGSVQVQ
jgi:uncharacterized repeat protein (TIGR03803 family)